ncbi:MAG: bacillithiol biosynthesis deacetylase BshB1, partial [Candidatus Latescibacteria bacterium]|nr:bacillithiol biosynthesis deacetylase BshB1 [Candidatus Latescibacterota bacterium]
VAVVDFTRGELGSRGTPETRAEESAAADEVLGVAVRENLGLPDGGLTDSLEARRLVVDALRRHRPTLVAGPWVEDLHPDHAAAGRVVAAALYPSGFAKYETGTPPYRPAGLVHYMNHYAFEPSFVLDVTRVWETRLEAVKCYRSQLHDPDSKEPATNISAPGFLDRLAARYRHYGSMIGTEYGEPYRMHRPPGVSDPVALFSELGRPEEQA